MRKRTYKTSDFHSDWLSQVDIDGPFLAYPVLKDMWPNGVDRLGDTDDRLITFKQAFAQWQRAFDQYVEQPKTPEAKSAYDAVRRAWIDVVLSDIAEWGDHRTDADITVRSPGEQITVAATGALNGRDGNPAALLLICEPTSGLRDAGLDGWAANDIDRLAMLLRKSQVEVGLVTDGQWWALVWAMEGKPTGSGMVNALTWAEEPLLRDAFFTLSNQRRFRASDPEQRLSRLFERSELEAEEITEALGTQVRRSVELLVQAFSEARLEAARAGDPDPLTEKPDDIYQAAVTVMMRIVFLLFAEERDMLPTEALYWDSYAIRDLLDDLRAQAAGGEEHLDETFDSWHRLLAVSQALHGGVNYDEMRMPAYGGSLLDPERFPWLHATDARGLRLKVSDRVMLHVLESVQTVVAKGERRRISFREIDVEQIGYIYEGLLGYSCAEVTEDIILGLVGKEGAEPEVSLGTINDLYDEHGGDAKKFATALTVWVKENQPAATGKTAAALAKLVEKEPTGEERAELVRLLTPVADGDTELLDTLVSWGNLIRRDLRNIPLVFPRGGLVVIETPSRKNAGAHYTPRSLAEEVVLHALQPLVYEPGPLQTNDENAWRLKPAAAILNLRAADIAAGSGAFLVAAARYLSERLVEAWVAEGMLERSSLDAEELSRRAIREVIARCLYGADINPMAVEMCKLSLWLVSMDKTKPFSFVDDKVFCGNALLGLTSLDQLRYLHIDPKPSMMQQQILVDIDAKIAAATRLRHELASPVDEQDPMRSTRGKLRLLRQVQEATDELRLIADGVVAASLPLGGKPGRQLDDAYKALAWQLQQAFPHDGSGGDRTKLLERVKGGLTPTVSTDYERWEPLHWVIEAPDILVERGGFDAIIGNPAFLHSKKISSAFGVSYRAFLQHSLANGTKGDADLAAYFLLRQVQITNGSGLIGLVVTKSIGQSSTYKVGLAQALREARLLRMTQPFDWGSGDAAVSVVNLWLARGAGSAELEPLTPKGARPVRAYVGTYPNGDGFRIPSALANQWLAEDRSLAQYLRPYVRAGDISGASLKEPVEALIEVNGMSEDEARKAGPAWHHLVEHQLPWRSRPSVKPRLREKWWWFEAAGEALYAELGSIDRCIVLPRTSNLVMPRFAPSDIKYDIGVVVFPTDSWAVYGQLASSLHYHWVLSFAATTRDDPSYAPKRVSDTFPWITDVASFDAVRRFEAELEVACESQGGLRPVINAFNAPRDAPMWVERLRERFVELDREVFEWFGWADLSPDYGVFERNNLERFTIDPETRAAVLQRLLEINHRRAGDRVKLRENVGG